MKAYIRIEDTPRGVRIALLHDTNGVTDAPLHSIAVSTMAVLVAQLLRMHQLGIVNWINIEEAFDGEVPDNPY